MNNFPLYIPSKSRHGSMLTSRALNEMNSPHYIIVEESQYEDYKKALDVFNITTATLLILDKKYQDEYDTFDDLGYEKSKGPGAARNFAWDHSIQNGNSWHLVMDDNIRAFYYYNENKYYKVKNKIFWKIMEDFVLRYENIAIAGMGYSIFCPYSDFRPPLRFNTRIYSNLLIRNDINFRWRGRYNEDTDICLRVLKDGDCTIQFNSFLQGKSATQTVKGGNTAEFYHAEGNLDKSQWREGQMNATGTVNKSQMLVDMHPDVAKLVWKYGRWHHHVDYLPFQKPERELNPEQLQIRRNLGLGPDDNRLRLKPGVDLSTLPKVNNYGMVLKKISKT